MPHDTFPSERLSNLAPNWDSHGALPPSPRTIIEAHKVWTKLPGDGWQVVPISGGVQIERHRDEVDIEITVTAAKPQE